MAPEGLGGNFGHHNDVWVQQHWLRYRISQGSPSFHKKDNVVQKDTQSTGKFSRRYELDLQRRTPINQSAVAHVTTNEIPGSVTAVDFCQREKPIVALAVDI